MVNEVTIRLIFIIDRRGELCKPSCFLPGCELVRMRHVLPGPPPAPIIADIMAIMGLTAIPPPSPPSFDVGSPPPPPPPPIDIIAIMAMAGLRPLVNVT